MTIVDKEFEFGDYVKVAESAWDSNYDVLSKFGFQRNIVYEVSGVYSNGSISLGGKPSLYFPNYFELAKDRDIQVEADTTNSSFSALDKQVSGNHYKDCGIQPIEYIHANNLSYLEGNVIKYTTRHSKKNGKQDILKAIHYLELILEMEYKGETN